MEERQKGLFIYLESKAKRSYIKETECFVVEIFKFSYVLSKGLLS